MGTFSENGYMNRPEARSNQLLTLAGIARDGGEKALAAHLYCAAFQASKAEGSIPSPGAIVGLRRAWDLACELGNRCLAETIFNELNPYNTPDQMNQGVMRLQELAVSQLEGLGITQSDLETMADTIGHDVVTALDADALTESLKDVFDRMTREGEPFAGAKGATLSPSPVAALSAPGVPASGAPIALALPGPSPSEQERGRSDDADDFPLTYADLAGFETALREMQAYGFESAGDDRYRSFVRMASKQHGVEGLSLFEPFIFYGPSREDTADFAEATAGEIGWPLVTMHVELDEQGVGGIKLSGPFKRTLFGAPDFTEIPTPCTLLIRNADLLYELFDRLDQISGEGDYGNDCPARRAQAEVLSYLNMIVSKSDLFIIATARDAEAIGRPLLDLLGPVQCIYIGLPNKEERCQVWKHLASEHPSFAEFDFSHVVDLSDGVSRRDLVVAGRAAVESAYRASLRSGSFQKISQGDLLTELAPFVRDNTEAYQRLEDAAVAQFRLELED